MPPIRVTHWEVKVSKLCNMRCAYCYEFEELGDRRRIPLECWRAILEGARWYREQQAERHPGSIVTVQFMWHGGEPTLLPLSYYREVRELQREVLGEDVDRYYSNEVPTNLLSLSPALFDFFREERFQLAVSFDGAPGVRVDCAGKSTEERVSANLERLMADGWSTGCTTVLAAHSAGRLCRTHRYLRDLSNASAGRIYHHVIPLHATPTDDGHTPFSLGEEPIAEALFALFRQWVDDPEPIQLTPIQDYYLAALRKVHGLPRRHFSRREWGETCILVNTDGGLYLFNDAYDPEKSLGNLFEQPFSEICASEAYRESLRRDEALEARYCAGCPYDGYCNHEPLVNSHRDHRGERCAVGFPVLQKIERWLRDGGYDRPERLAEIPRRECVLA